MNHRPMLSTGLHTAKSAAAVVLVLATILGAIPPSAVFASDSSEMDCCKGMSGAMKDSCPFMRLKQAQQKKAAQSDPMCHMDMGASASTDGDSMHIEHAPTELYPASAGSTDGVESAPDQSASSQDTTTKAGVFLAAVSKPCSSDCCCRTNSFTRTQRPRDEAAFSEKLRPRPPTSGVGLQVSQAVSDYASKARRQCPPRGPPPSLASLSA